jgi:glutamate racemase
MSSACAIGVFDSGFGGLTIFKKISERLPGYDYIYLGDNARSPYGNRSFETVNKFTQECVDYLFARGCPLVIIACNTASAKALRNIQQLHLPRAFPDRRVLGVIRPTVEAVGRALCGAPCGAAGAAEPAARAAEPAAPDRTVALWATQGTVKSESFALEIAKHAPSVKLVQQACPLLVPLVEAGELSGAGLDHFIAKYWQQTAARAERLDALLLACTHYPLILPRIRALVPAAVDLISQDEMVAPSLADYLKRHPEMDTRLTRGGSCRFLTTDTCEHFDHLAEIFMGHAIQSEKVEVVR